MANDILPAASATGAHSTTAQALKIGETLRYDQYRGTASELIAAGLVKPGQFPGDPGQSQTVVALDMNGDRVGRGRHNRTTLRIEHAGGGRFTVLIVVSQEEQRRRRTAAASERRTRQEAAQAAERMREAEEAVVEARESLSRHPTSSAEYCRRAADIFWIGVNMVHNEYIPDGFHGSGYRFNNATKEKIMRMSRALYWLIRNSADDEDGVCNVIFSREHREKRLNEALLKAAKVDQPLQKLIADVSQMSASDIVEA